MRALTPLAFQNEFLDRACFNLAVPLTRFEPRSSWPLTAADKFVSEPEIGRPARSQMLEQLPKVGDHFRQFGHSKGGVVHKPCNRHGVLKGTQVWS